MSAKVERREIKIDPFGEVAKSLSEEIVSERDEQGSAIQALSGDIEGMTVTGEVRHPPEVLERAKDALRRVGHDEIPVGVDGWGVVAVDIAVDEPSTVTIEVRDA